MQTIQIPVPRSRIGEKCSKDHCVSCGGGVPYMYYRLHFLCPVHEDDDCTVQT